MVAESDMPDHDLEPPRFCRRALERLLNDWPAVQCTIMAGIHEESNAQQLFGDQGQACRQSGTALLDKFTHLLLVKCNAEGVLVNLQQHILFFFSFKLSHYNQMINQLRFNCFRCWIHY